jgi:hypothetical protein
MTTISICAFVSLLSAASPTASYRHPAQDHATAGQSASQGVAQVNRMIRQGSLNGRGQVWRPSDVQVGSPRTMARSSTSTHSFLLAGK